MTPSEKPFLHFVVEPDLLSRVDDFRFEHRFESRAAAIKWLVAWALERGAAPTEEDRPAKAWGRKARKNAAPGD